MKSLIFGHFSGFLALIILLGQVAHIENIELVLRQDNLYTNADMLTFECEVYGFQIVQVSFINIDTYEEVFDDRPNGIGIYGNSLIFTFSKINGTALDGNYRCQINNRPIISNSINFNLKHYVAHNKKYLTTTTTEKPERIKPNITLKVAEWCSLNEMKVDDKCHFYCVVQPNNFKIKEYIWFHDGEIVQTDYSTDTYVLGEDESELAFSKIQKSHHGDYFCYGVTEKMGVLRSNRVTMFILDAIDPKASPRTARKNEEKPKVILKLANWNSPDDITVNNPLGFNCTVEAKNITINRRRWFQDGREIFNASEFGISMSTDGSLLRFSQAKIFHTGAYSCHVETFRGLLQSDYLQVTVRYQSITTTTTEIPTTSTETPSTTTTEPSTTQLIILYFTEQTIIHEPVKLRLADKIQPTDIQQYDHVEFICDLKRTGRSYTIVRTNWFCNDMPIYENITAGVILNGSKLIMERIEMKFNGTYKCELISISPNETLESNLLEIRIRKAFYLKINSTKMHLELGKEFEKDNIKEWDSVYLICRFRGNKTNIREMYWVHDYVPIYPNKDADVVQTNTILVLPKIQKQSSGRYFCVTEDYDNIAYRSNILKIDVKDTLFHLSSSRPLFIADMPYDPNLIEEDDYETRITCKVYYDDAAVIKKITWFHNDQKVDPWVKYKSDLKALDLFIKNIEEKYLGNYSCSDVSIKDAISVPLSLPEFKKKSKPYVHISRRKYTGPPRIRARITESYNPAQVHVEANMTIILICDVTDTSNILQLSWFHDGKEMISNDKFDLLYGNYTLVLIEMDSKSFGTFHCQAETRRGETPVPSNPATVGEIWGGDPLPIPNVTLVAEVLADPDLVFEDEEIFLFCNIYPKTFNYLGPVVWLHNGKIMEQGVAMFERKVLKFNHIKLTDSGNYKCQITTDYNDTIISLPVPLNVNERILGFSPYNRTNLTLHTSNNSQTEENIREGDTVKFICDVIPKSTKVFHYNWIRNNKVIYQKDTEGIFYRKNKVLIFDDIAKSSNGSYRCTGDSKRGLLTSNFFNLYVQNGPIEEPKQLPKWRIG